MHSRTRALALAGALAVIPGGAACSSSDAAAPTQWVTVDATTTVAGSSPTAPETTGTAATTSSTAGASPAGLLTFKDPGKVHRADKPSAFLSQGGTTQCIVSADKVVCEPHSSWEAPAGNHPTPDGYCPDGRQSTGMVLSGKGNAWYCGDGDPARAMPGSPETAWAPPGTEQKDVAGTKLVVLPYDAGIVVGDYQCVDLRDGVECRRLSTQDGFKMTKSEIRWSGTMPGARSQY